MTASIEITNASLTFSVYRNRSPNLKEQAVGMHKESVRALNKVLKFQALQDINLVISGGERVGIIGFNGAGKSTLLKLMLGIYPPDSGSVVVKGSVSPLLELTGHFDFELTGRENLHMKGSYLGFSSAQMRKVEQSALDFAEVGDFIDVPVKYYSSGMVLRLAFSVATMLHAQILLLDEVFAVGDGYFIEKAKERMLNLIGNSQIVVMISHNVDHLRQICNRIIWLHSGRVVGDGPVDEMLEAYRQFIEQQSSRQVPSEQLVESLG